MYQLNPLLENVSRRMAKYIKPSIYGGSDIRYPLFSKIPDYLHQKTLKQRTGKEVAKAIHNAREIRKGVDDLVKQGIKGKPYSYELGIRNSHALNNNRAHINQYSLDFNDPKLREILPHSKHEAILDKEFNFHPSEMLG